MRLVRRWWVDGVALAIGAALFLVPFAFILVTAGKDQSEAHCSDFTWPTEWHLWDNVPGCARPPVTASSSPR